MWTIYLQIERERNKQLLYCMGFDGKTDYVDVGGSSGQLTTWQVYESLMQAFPVPILPGRAQAARSVRLSSAVYLSDSFVERASEFSQLIAKERRFCAGTP